MKEITDKLLSEYFQRYGLEFDKLGDLGWTTLVDIGNDTKNIGITVWEETVIFSIYPLEKVNCRECRPKLTQHLLLLNAETHFVKYGIDESWNIILSVEYPVKEFSYGLFSVAMDSLIEAVKKHYEGIKKLIIT